MIQVQIDEFGGPEVLKAVEAADPVARPGEVLIRVEAAGITFVETQMRAGTFAPPGAPPIAFPFVLGNGVEGTVVAAGTEAETAADAGSGLDLVGRRVVSATGGSGGYAELVAVDASLPFPVPDGLGPGEAVAMLADGRTALGLARAAAFEPGDRVLVTAAAGGVGNLLVQLAHHAGARVVAAIGDPAKAAIARVRGADEVVSYLDPAWVDAVRASGQQQQLDVVLDGVGGDIGNAALACLRNGGRALLYGKASGEFADSSVVADRDVTMIPGSSLVQGPDDNRALVEQALAAAANRTLRPLVGQSFPLAEAAEAHRAIEARTTVGKTILVTGARSR